MNEINDNFEMLPVPRTDAEQALKDFQSFMPEPNVVVTSDGEMYMQRALDWGDEGYVRVVRLIEAEDGTPYKAFVIHQDETGTWYYVLDAVSSSLQRAIAEPIHTELLLMSPDIMQNKPPLGMATLLSIIEEGKERDLAQVNAAFDAISSTVDSYS